MGMLSAAHASPRATGLSQYRPVTARATCQTHSLLTTELSTSHVVKSRITIEALGTVFGDMHQNQSYECHEIFL